MTDDPYERVVSRLSNVRGNSALCPAHDDTANSLSISRGTDQPVVLHCHRDCTPEEIVAAIGLTMADLIDNEPRLEKTYRYTDEDGNLIFTVDRWHNWRDDSGNLHRGKTFRTHGLPARHAQRVLYNMPRIKLARMYDQPVYVVEGEKDADTLNDIGYFATCNVSGAGEGKWLEHYGEFLKGLDVIIVADIDEVGQRHANTIRRSLRDRARSVVMLQPKVGKDVTEHIEAGYRVDDLLPLAPVHLGLAAVRGGDVMTNHSIPWLWPGRIPMGTLTLIDGDPGDGKSVLLCRIIAHVTTGMRWPDDVPASNPAPVIMFSAEDGLTTVAQRLEAAGADRNIVFIVPHVNATDAKGDVTPRPFDLGTDLHYLRETIQQTGAKLITIDPLMAYLPEKTDSYKDASVRKALLPLTMLAEEEGVAILVVRHLTKGGTKALYKGGGSIAFIGAARAGYLVAPDPVEDDVRVIACVKSNLAAKPPALRYKITVNTVLNVPVVRWAGTSGLSAQQLLDAQAEAGQREPRQEVRDFLTELLSGVGTQVLTWKQIRRYADQAGVDSSEHTLRRARNDLGLVKTIRGAAGADRTVVWSLPKNVQLAQPAQGDISRNNEGNLPEEGKSNVIPLPGVTTTASVAQPDEATQYAPTEGKLGNLACDVCGTADGVTIYEPGMPFLSNTEDLHRCLAHSPFTYQADDDV